MWLVAVAHGCVFASLAFPPLRAVPVMLQPAMGVKCQHTPIEARLPVASCLMDCGCHSSLALAVLCVSWRACGGASIFFACIRARRARAQVMHAFCASPRSVWRWCLECLVTLTALVGALAIVRGCLGVRDGPSPSPSHTSCSDHLEFGELGNTCECAFCAHTYASTSFVA